MVRQVQALSAKPADLSLIPKSHMVEEENRPPQIVLLSPHTYTYT